MPRPAPSRLAGALLPLLLGAALLACGCGPPPPRHVLALDLKLEQSDGERTIRHATVLLDDRQVAFFDDATPESVVVFSKTLTDVAPGLHRLAIRIDAQTSSPRVYAAGGFATYDGKPHPLVEVGGALVTGDSLRFDVHL